MRALAVTAHIFVGERPQAFCVGLLRPRIFLSSGAVAILDKPELAAVLAHEAHHASRRDPLRVLVRVLADALSFLPIMRHAAARYEAMAEMAADEAAVRRCGDGCELAATMLTFDERAPAGTVGIAAEPVDHLLGQSPRWQLSLSLLAAAVATIAAVAMLGAATAAALPRRTVGRRTRRAIVRVRDDRRTRPRRSGAHPDRARRRRAPAPTLTASQTRHTRGSGRLAKPRNADASGQTRHATAFGVFAALHS